MFSHLPTQLLLLLSFSERVFSAPNQGAQIVITPPTSNDNDHTKAASSSYADAHADHVVEDSILAALSAHSDPVDALISLQPELAAELAERRLIHVFGEPEPVWMTEGDKLHLRRDRKKFMDITDHQELYAEPINTWSGKASMLSPATHTHSPI